MEPLVFLKRLAALLPAPGCTSEECGNDAVEGGEVCDTTDLLGQDCVSINQGFVGGTLACDATCVLDVSGCTPLIAGDDCASAGVIDPAILPLTLYGSTTGANDDYASSTYCGIFIGDNEGDGSPDVVYAFTPSQTGLYVFDYTPTFDGAIYIVNDCETIDATTCLGGSEYGGANDTETALAELNAGTTYYIILDAGVPWGADGDFTLVVSDICHPDCTGKVCGDDGCRGYCGICTWPDYCAQATGQCMDRSLIPGNTCTTPIVVGSAPYTDSDDTNWYTDDYVQQSGDCPGLTGYDRGNAAGDVVYEFTPGTTGSYTFSVTPSGFDVGLYVTTTCGDFATT